MSTFSTRRPVQDPLSAVLSTTPLSAKTQEHLRRVYGTLTLGVIVAAVGAIIDAYIGSISLGLFAGLMSLPALIWFMMQSRGSKNRPRAFYLFAFLDGMAAGPLIQLSVDADPRLPMLALGGCVVVFAGFSLAALFAKRRSYLFLGSFLWTALMGMMFINFVNLFTSRYYGFNAMLYGGLFVMFGFVIYDTQMIVEKVELGDNDHFSHAMELLVDFVIIFKRLLIIMLKNDQQRKEKENRRRKN